MPKNVLTRIVLAILVGIAVVNLLLHVYVGRPEPITEEELIAPDKTFPAYPEIMEKARALQQETERRGLSEKQIIAVVASYNNRDYVVQNLISLITQKQGKARAPYYNWLVVYCDDCSTDGTYEKVLQFIHEQQVKDHMIVLRNSVCSRSGFYNHHKVITQCPDEAIIASVDGDDALAHDHVFERLNKEYQNPDVWMTYGTFMDSHGQISKLGQVPKIQVTHNNYRKSFYASHLKTFYVWLYKKIEFARLLVDGELMHAAYDQAMMMPMLEMAGQHSKYIPEVLYYYNTTNPLGGTGPTVFRALTCLHNKPRYKPLKSRDERPSIEPFILPELYG